MTPVFQMGTLEVIGPKTGEFCAAFRKHKATLLKADGIDIISVTMTVKSQFQNNGASEAG